MLLEGRTALITGASRGIGLAIARGFTQEGASVMICARGPEVMEVAETLRQQGARAEARQGDLRDPAFRKSLVMACRQVFGHLDVLVNNAGILRMGLIGMTSGEDLRDLFAVNIEALIELTQFAVRLMRPERQPAIVNLTSIAGTGGMEGVSVYGASKAAVLGFTLCAAKELAAKGIRVNAIAPGFIDTDMTRGLSPDWYARRMASIPMGRIGTPEDVAGAALFLASPLAAYISGQVLGVDGGMLA